MAEIIDLEEERRKRRGTLVECHGCRKVFSAGDIELVADDAELFLLCSSCDDEFSSRELHTCDCGRAVFFLYETDNNASVCAFCLKNNPSDPLPENLPF